MKFAEYLRTYSRAKTGVSTLVPIFTYILKYFPKGWSKAARTQSTCRQMRSLILSKKIKDEVTHTTAVETPWETSYADHVVPRGPNNEHTRSTTRFQLLWWSRHARVGDTRLKPKPRLTYINT